MKTGERSTQSIILALVAILLGILWAFAIFFSNFFWDLLYEELYGLFLFITLSFTPFFLAVTALNSSLDEKSTIAKVISLIAAIWTGYVFLPNVARALLIYLI